MTIKTKFELAQQVYIPRLKVAGRVKAFYQTTHGGLQYSVRYFPENGTPSEVYLFEDELTAEIPAETRAGFAKAKP